MCIRDIVKTRVQSKVYLLYGKCVFNVRKLIGVIITHVYKLGKHDHVVEEPYTLEVVDINEDSR
jgi:hypothetical protein